MSSARHTPPDDNSFSRSLLQHLGAALALVLVVAAGFWAIGQVDGGDDDVAVVAEPSPTEEPVAAASPSEPTPTAAGTTAPEPTPTATTPEPEPSPEPSPEPTATQELAPAEVSIQVLDAVLDDGGEAAQKVADELEADGYDVVVVNDSFRKYDQTTVFYTDGQQAAAQQLASQYGFAAVEPKPDNLSDSVDIHLVVGADRA